MAVVQISRIQIRRGKANAGTGFPQLASGELGWAIDTQELYIGNGSVSEGSPAVGNTKVLTELDLSINGNVLNLIQHVYRSNDTTITTGVDSNNPTARSIQDRFDDRVSVADFGAFGVLTNPDDTATLQRAIDQLFLNPTTPASTDTDSGVSKRVELTLGAGTYKTSSTLYIPSYATLNGAGKDKTIIDFDPSYNITGNATIDTAFITTTSADVSMLGATILGDGVQNNTTITSVNPGVSITLSNIVNAATLTTYTIIPAIPAIQFINDASTIGHPSPISNTLGVTQPRNIEIKGITVRSLTGVNTCLQLDAVKNSVFEDIKLVGTWGNQYNILNRGIFMQALSSIVTCEHNLFKNITFQGCTFGVWATQDVRFNTFKDCYFEDGYQGLALGVGANGTGTAQQYGPRETDIDTCKFYNIKKHAVYVELGSANTTRDCKYVNVGNDGGSNASAKVPQVYFKSAGNISQNDYSDRHADLSTDSLVLTTPYVPEIAGHCTYTLQGVKQVGISYVTSNLTFGFRLPVAMDQYGAPIGSINHSVDYFYKSDTNSFTRKGTFTISADVDSTKIQSADDYEFAGSDSSEDRALALSFTATFLDELGAVIDTNNVLPGQTPYSIAIYYTNTLSSDTGTLTYTYTTSL